MISSTLWVAAGAFLNCVVEREALRTKLKSGYNKAKEAIVKFFT